MAKTYDFPGKIARILKDDHGIDAQVAGLPETGEAGMRVTVGDFSETIRGVITREKLAQLSARIREAHRG
jgi:hypothetical protein